MNDEYTQQAFKELVNLAVLMGEEAGTRRIAALHKAADQIAHNTTIRFNGYRLTFVSAASGKTRNVTRFGCSDLCDCGNQPSYHQALFDILKRAGELRPVKMENAPYFQKQLNPSRPITKIGNIRI